MNFFGDLFGNHKEIPSLVAQLWSGSAGQQAEAAEALGALAAGNADNQAAIVRVGGIEPLVALVRSGGAEAQAEAAGALHMIAYENDDNKAAIARAGGIEPLLVLVRGGSAWAQRCAAYALDALADNNDDNQAAIKHLGGKEALEALARDGSGQAQQAAAALLKCISAAAAAAALPVAATKAEAEVAAKMAEAEAAAKAKAQVEVQAEAALSAPAPAIAGLEALLQGLNMADKLDAAAAWCVENGADCVRELEGYEETFADALFLPPIRRGKLINAFKQSKARERSSSSSLPANGEQRTVADETYTVKEQLNPGGNAMIWRVIDDQGKKVVLKTPRRARASASQKTSKRQRRQYTPLEDHIAP